MKNFILYFHHPYLNFMFAIFSTSTISIPDLHSGVQYIVIELTIVFLSSELKLVPIVSQ